MARLTFALLCVAFAVCILGITAEDGFCDHKGEKIPYGQYQYTENPCMKLRCNDDGTMSGVGCPTFQAPGCKVEKGTGPYPACCEHPVCPK